MLFDRLAASERESLADLQDDPHNYGLLRPRSEADGLGVKTVDRETALLFLTLGTPAPLPSYVRNYFGADAGRDIARLVADSVLEVDAGSGFVRGADALPLLAGKTGRRNHGRIARLSHEALRYAQALSIAEPFALANRIYRYNRLPLTPMWRRLLPDTAAHARYLGISDGGPALAALAQAWSSLASSSHWMFWTARGKRRASSSGRSYKLYVSPKPESLSGDGFAQIVSALTAARATSFKTGAGVTGMLRPDKIVGYFADFESLGEGASRIGERLDGMPAHGVPFTAEIGGHGLLSWGVDPPRHDAAWTSTASWRMWLAQRLAQAIIAARGTPEPWRFAVERLRLEDIDTENWTPGARIFENA